MLGISVRLILLTQFCSLLTVILLEPPHSGKTGQGTAGLVSVKDTKVSIADREFTMASLAVAEH